MKDSVRVCSRVYVTENKCTSTYDISMWQKVVDRTQQKRCRRWGFIFSFSLFCFDHFLPLLHKKTFTRLKKWDLKRDIVETSK